jgi:heat shock protein HslJ
MMKRLFIAAGALVVAAAWPACATKSVHTAREPTADTSRTSLDWNGVYTGVVPCADCEGIATTVVLSTDGTYRAETQYKGKGTAWNKSKGSFGWNDAGNTITLKPAGGGETTQYRVGENTLTQLDRAGRTITGNLAANYVLTKDQTGLTEKYWKLVELEGAPVAADPGQRREPFILFKAADTRVVANGGCNGMGGSYTLSAPGRISFSQMVSTMMVCPDMSVEVGLKHVLQTADSYVIRDDTLVLNRARMAPLARFKVMPMPDGL